MSENAVEAFVRQHVCIGKLHLHLIPINLQNYLYISAAIEPSVDLAVVQSIRVKAFEQEGNEYNV